MVVVVLVVDVVDVVLVVVDVVDVLVVLVVLVLVVVVVAGAIMNPSRSHNGINAVVVDVVVVSSVGTPTIKSKSKLLQQSLLPE